MINEDNTYSHAMKWVQHFNNIQKKKYNISQIMEHVGKYIRNIRYFTIDGKKYVYPKQPGLYEWLEK